MKNLLHINPILFRIGLLVACFMLVIMYNKSKAAGLPAVLHANNRTTVNFKSTIKNNELTIHLKSGREALMQLFIFSADGILIKELALSTRKTTTINCLEKGLYFYECFDNNERMKSGSLLIK